ncbi:MbcA/ParS/Xre antitoxin family protein [Alteromonas sp.]
MSERAQRWMKIANIPLDGKTPLEFCHTTEGIIMLKTKFCNSSTSW